MFYPALVNSLDRVWPVALKDSGRLPHTPAGVGAGGIVTCHAHLESQRG